MTSNQFTPTHHPDALLRVWQVLQIIPVSRSGFWQGVRDGRYPQPIKLSPGVTVWQASKIYDFVGSLQNGATE